jgi:hypothetical protein
MTKIYESPDGGKTVYEREMGATKRTLIQSPVFLWNEYMEAHDWDDIAEDPNIQSVLERLKTVVALCKE